MAQDGWSKLSLLRIARIVLIIFPAAHAASRDVILLTRLNVLYWLCRVDADGQWVLQRDDSCARVLRVFNGCHRTFWWYTEVKLGQWWYCCLCCHLTCKWFHAKVSIDIPCKVGSYVSKAPCWYTSTILVGKAVYHPTNTLSSRRALLDVLFVPIQVLIL